MKRNLLLIFIPISLLFACATRRLPSPLTIKDLPVPPGTIKISENLYIDRIEIRNLDYGEYLNWTKEVYGAESDEYKNAIPSSDFWEKVNPLYRNVKGYTLEPDYRLVSVLGVSNEQAKDFSKWRSDRVMEFMLIRYKILEWNPKPTKESMFSIEKYFMGKYRNLRPDVNVMFYPEYKLLDSLEDTSTGFKTICTYRKWEQQ